MQLIKDLQIFDTAYGGYGIGRDSTGKVIMTPYTVEGDTVDVEIVEDKKSFAYAKLLDIKIASDKRSKTIDCKYYDSCGGCLFMHIEKSAEIDIKKKIFLNSLRKYNDEIPDIEIEDSPSLSYRLRSSVQVRNGKIGFYRFRSREFVEVDRCPILVFTLSDKIASFVERYNFSGELYAIETDQSVALASITTDNEFHIKDTVDFAGVEVNGKRHGLSRLNYNTTHGPVAIGYKSFFQSNRYLINKFQEYAVGLADDYLNTLEIYAGAGFFTAGLSKLSSFIEGVESGSEAVSLAKSNGYKVMKSDAERYLAMNKDNKKIEQIFLDPPREGLSKRVLQSIRSITPQSIIYVSCNPTTVGRDIVLLSDLYQMKSIKFFNNYPNTHHAEIVVKLLRRG